MYTVVRLLWYALSFLPLEPQQAIKRRYVSLFLHRDLDYRKIAIAPNVRYA